MLRVSLAPLLSQGGLLALLAFTLAPPAEWAAEAAPTAAPVEFRRDQSAGTVRVLIGSQEACVFRYGPDVDLPHYYPLRSPSGQLLTVQQTNPYPHHRSLWFADKIELHGHPPVEFYMAFVTRDPQNTSDPFANRIRHTEFLPGSFDQTTREIRSKLVWEANRGQRPYLDEQRVVRVVPLGEGEYLLDMIFTVAAAYDAVTFRSDAVHYAWPFVRMHAQFSVEQGGTITNSEGGTNEKGTHNQFARWVDYSNTVNGQREGLTLFSHAQNAHPHRWLTRDYGTFGPRRVDDRSGKPFVLEKGQTLRQRVGILVHRGDVRSGRVAERYQEYLTLE